MHARALRLSLTSPGVFAVHVWSPWACASEDAEILMGASALHSLTPWNIWGLFALACETEAWKFSLVGATLG